MTEIFLRALPSPSTGISPVTSGTGISSATQVPPQLQGLPSGSVIQGFVLNRDASGNPILRTPGGDFLIQSNFFLKIGSEVIIRLDTAGKNLRANILSVDGLSPSDAENTPAHNTDADIIIRSDPGGARRSAATAEQAQAARAQGTVSATLLYPPPEGDSPLSSTTVLLLKLAGVSLPQATGTQPQPAAPTQTTPRTTAQTAGDTPDEGESTPLGSALARQYGAYAKHAPHPATGSGQQAPPEPVRAALPSPGSVIEAEVIPPEEPDEMLARSTLGTLKLSNMPPLPAGSKISLELLSLATQDMDAADLPQTLARITQSWPSVTSLMNALLELDSDAATQFLRHSLPASAMSGEQGWKGLLPTAQNIGSAMYAFLAALQGGGARAWLGERAARLLEAHGHGPALSRLEAEFSAMRTMYTESSGLPWQMLFFPLLAEGEVRPMRMYVKRDRKQKTKPYQPDEGDTRFVVEFELSALGPLQLDGLVRKQDGRTQFDLMIRSHNALDGRAQVDIQAIYTMIGEATGYKGMVLFQDMPEFTVKPLEEILTAYHRDVLA